MVESCDTLIIGGGLSGLSTAYNLRNTTQKVILCEASSRVGGRISTSYYRNKQGDTLSFDTGAGRFCKKHQLLFQLLKELKLTDNLGKNSVPTEYYRQSIGNNDKYNKVGVPLDTEKLINLAVSRFKQAGNDSSELVKYTLSELTEQFLTPREHQWCEFAYPYDTKFQKGNARIFLKVMRHHYTQQFYHLNGGLDEMIARLVDNLGTTTVQLRTRCRSVHKISKDSQLYYRVETITGEEHPNTIYAKNLVVAVPPRALHEIQWDCLNLQPTRWIDSYQLYRIYAIYPKGRGGKVWFHNLSRIITDNPIRYIIPINPKTGLIMICYQNGDGAERIRKYATGDKKLKQFIKDNLRKLFPAVAIPDPIFLQGYFWDPGTHYYLPGINPKEQFNWWTRPSDDPLWVVGESYSDYQGWMEGSLRSSEAASQQILARIKMGTGDTDSDEAESRGFEMIPTKIPDNLPTYTLKQVAKHNKRDDAWIALFGYVYDVTDWISSHPGGDAILKGIGREYSRDWKQVSAHRMRKSDIRNILNKYLIGTFVR